jgi:ubiquinone/menaquinone biosynthesis C-methylase UbiE
MEAEKYLHGFTPVEQQRLYKQARILENIIYADVDLSAVTQLLEVGSGVGAQSGILLRRFPDLFLTCLDFSETQITAARQYLSSNPVAKDRFEIMQMDASDIDLPAGTKHDGAFLCWILEHVPEPLKVLSEVRRILKPGSKVVITEVLNSSFFLDPYSPNVLQYWMRYNDLQYDMGGDPFIGGKLGNMLQSLGYTGITTKVKTIMLDNRNPVKRAEMISFWAELLMSGTDNLVKKGYIQEDTAEKMSHEMKRVAKDPNAVFFYAFVQAEAYT